VNADDLSISLHIPKDDPATFEIMQRADTIGFFKSKAAPKWRHCRG